MDSILNGILNSNKSEKFKQQFIERVIIPSACKPLSNKTCISLLCKTCNLAIYGESSFVRDIGLKVFITFSQSNKSTLEKFLTPELFASFKQDVDSSDKTRLIHLLHASMVSLKERELPSFLVGHVGDIILLLSSSDLHTVKAIAVLIKDFPLLVSADNLETNLITHLIDSVSKFTPTVSNTKEASTFVSDVTTVCAYLKQSWLNASDSVLMASLQTIHNILCDVTEPSLTLAAVVQVLPIKFVNQVSGFLVQDTTLMSDDLQLTRVVSRMVDWLNWPIATNIHLWIMSVFDSLYKAKKCSILVNITDAKIQQVADRLFIPVGRSGVFVIFRHMLLAFQHSPDAFHKVIEQSAKLIDVFKEDSVLMEDYVEVLYSMFYLHSGFPDLYEPLLKSIANYPVTSTSKIQERLSSAKWELKTTRAFSKRDNDCLDSSRKGKHISESGLIGLENLGNTCYVNSIVQLLFMTTPFTVAVLDHRQNACRIMKVLQHLFVYFVHSKRMAISPSDFLQATKPPWFECGKQQDCAEFLRYFLDMLLEEEISKRKESAIVRQTFFGKLETCYECSKCRLVSRNYDDLVDIGLAFTKELVENVKESCFYRTRNKVMEAAEDENVSNSSVLYLEDLIKIFLKPEAMEGENRYHCQKCSSVQNAIRTVNVTKHPQHLILHLLRFSYSTKSRSQSKICHKVNVPKTLIFPTGVQDNGYPSKIIYSLYGVVMHSGTSSDCGHYYSYGRRLTIRSTEFDFNDVTRDTDLYSDDWFLFNDSRVSKSSYNSCGLASSRFPADTPYLLFYQNVSDDGHRVENTDLKTIQVPTNLLQMVLKDNQDLLKEEEELQRKRSRSSFFMSNISSWNDYDEDGSAPQGGSSCGLGNIDLSVSNFVF